VYGACLGLHLAQAWRGRLAWVPVYVAPARDAGSHPVVRSFWSPAIAAASELAPGDEILAVGGASLRGAGRLDFLARVYQHAGVSHEVPLEVRSGGSVREVRLELLPVPLSWRASVLAIAFVALGALAFWRTRGFGPARLFFAFAFCYGLHWSYFWGGPPLQTLAGIAAFALGPTLALPLAVRATLSDEEARALAELGKSIEAHYGAPQDTEWAIDLDGRTWILQARPVTALSSPAPSGTSERGAQVLLRGLGAGPGRAGGPVTVVGSLAEAAKFGDGAVLVTRMTAPDWVPLMRRAAAIATDSGGMTCHAAIVSRELGIPCVVGTQDATKKLRDGEVVTVDGTHGLVLEGWSADADTLPEPPRVHRGDRGGPTATALLLNLSEPSQVSRAAALDVDGVGLLRAELMVIEALDGAHPRLLLEEGRGEEFVERMSDALTTFAAGFAPRPVTYRTIDFRTNEFRGLRGGDRFEPEEANPMIGYRGVFRYVREPDLFGLELDALRRVWDAGNSNLHVMLPFVRTAAELASCRALIASSGLADRAGFELWIMAEVPSVLFNLERYAELGVAGISIGSNDLTQLLLGADRDSGLLAELDERDPAVVAYLQQLIPHARSLGLKTSICGQAPSVHLEYADLLVRAGIDAISVNIDVVDRTRRLIDVAERRLLLDAARASLLGETS